MEYDMNDFLIPEYKEIATVRYGIICKMKWNLQKSQNLIF